MFKNSQPQYRNASDAPGYTRLASLQHSYSTLKLQVAVVLLLQCAFLYNKLMLINVRCVFSVLNDILTLWGKEKERN